MSEKILPDDHEFEFTASIWNGPTNDKPVSLILREVNPETCYHCEHDDLYIEIPFDQFDDFIAYLQKVRP